MTPGPAAMRRIAAAALAVVAFVWVLAAQRGEGIARDEDVYMRVADKYAAWWLDLVAFEDGTVTEKRISATFGGRLGGANNPEHPPLMKTLFGLSKKVFHDGLGWTSEVTGYRLPSALMFALLIALVVSFTARVWGWLEGVVAGTLVLLLPRTLFHAGLAAFDVPMMALWFAVIYAYWRALDSRGWCVWLALLFGCALATKHNAVLMPAALVPHYAWVAWKRHHHVRGLWKTRPLIWAALLVGAPLFAIGLWPWLWFDTFAHVGEWFSFHLKHVHYNFEYLGHNWNSAPFPWHIAIVTTLFTVPVATLAAGVIGAAELIRRVRAGEAADTDRAPALLLLLSAGVAMGPFLLTTTPIFGGEKHWMPAYVTICVYAGVGVVAAAGWAARAVWPERRTAVAGALGTIVALAAAVETFDAHPYALTHYNALAGGAPGAADKGMNRQFWGYAARGVLPWLRGQPSGRVYSHDAQPAWRWYIRGGLLPGGLPDSGREWPGVESSSYALVIHELHFNRHDYFIWKAYGTVQPAFVLRTDGVPIVSVYAKPE